jgi:hypothetical protein
MFESCSLWSKMEIPNFKIVLMVRPSGWWDQGFFLHLNYKKLDYLSKKWINISKSKRCNKSIKHFIRNNKIELYTFSLTGKQRRSRKHCLELIRFTEIGLPRMRQSISTLPQLQHNNYIHLIQIRLVPFSANLVSLSWSFYCRQCFPWSPTMFSYLLQSQVFFLYYCRYDMVHLF